MGDAVISGDGAEEQTTDHAAVQPMADVPARGSSRRRVERARRERLEQSAFAVAMPLPPTHSRKRSLGNGRKLGIALSYAVAFAVMLRALVRVEYASPRTAIVVGVLGYGLFLGGRYLAIRALPGVLGLVTRAVAGVTCGVFAVSIVVLGGARFDVIASGLAALAFLVFVVTTLHELGYRRRRIVLVGHGDATTQLLRDATEVRREFEVVATVGDMDPCPELGDVRHYGAIADLAEAVRAHRPDLVVVGVSSGRPEVFEALLDLAGSGFRVIDLPEFYAHAFGRVPVEYVSPAWFMSVLHLYRRAYTMRTKRTFDILGATFLLLVTLPLWLVIAVLIRRRIFFKQARVGQWGKTFTMYKFRTMREGSEEPGIPVFASVRDPRVTRVGRVLRRTRLDELPQLWNVLVGDMSLVGPRPERPEFYTSLSKQVPWWIRRTMLKPGITGWAQIKSGYSDDVGSAADKLSYDLWYLRHSSVLIDLMICLKTLPRLVSGFGTR
jgi:exopolysaccharide biosynthesis polyprenyl glycosylphosphotransferase